MKGGKRNGAGRPHLDKRIVKVPVSFRLQSWLVDWMREQPETQSKLIENALCNTYKIKHPELD